MSDSKRIEEYLDYLAHRIMREKAKVSAADIDKIRSIAEYISRDADQPEQIREYASSLSSAARHSESPELIYDLLHRLRSAFQQSMYHDVSAFTQRRVRELEAEVDLLRKQRQTEKPDEEEEETTDEHEDAVKKFNSSKNRVFIIMPFSADFDDVWTGGIRRACSENGFVPLRVDQVSLSSWITDDVEEFIKMSTTVIADVTGNNPNVMFELGYALARGKDPIIICQPQNSGKIPFDIAGIRHIPYEDSWKGIEQLAKDLKKFLLTTKSKQKERRIRKKASGKTGNPSGTQQAQEAKH